VTSAVDAPPIAEEVSALLGASARLERVLPGGTHAETVLISVGGRRLVARRFPPGEDAAAREVEVLRRLGPLGDLVPELVAVDGRLIVTTRVDGGPPDRDLDPHVIAVEMARTLARIHALDGTGLPPAPKPLRPSTTPIARQARDDPPDLDPATPVLVHHDYWCGNALWRGDRLTGVIDWSDARSGPRGADVAWCRQDLVLLDAPDAAETFRREYERAAGVVIDDLHAWDVRVGAYAEPVVETWAPNYLGIGRRDATAAVLRRRLDRWNTTLV
jgi:aminoglycoside phosphotransferase (APT) family kinase protein